MNFTDYIITQAVRNIELDEDMPNYFSLENVRFPEKVTITDAKKLYLYFTEEINTLSIDFILGYKGYALADIIIELYNPFRFDFIGNQERNTNIEASIKQLKLVFDTIFKFELSNENLIIQAKNESIDFQIKTHFSTIAIDIDFLNTMQFIDSIDKRAKNKELLYTICNEISNEQLITISKADYGYESDIAYAELVKIKETQRIPKEISYATAQVLSLTSLYQSETKEDYQEGLFACAIILLGAYDFTVLENIEDKLITLFLSANALGKNYVKQARVFFQNLLTNTTLLLEENHIIT